MKQDAHTILMDFIYLLIIPDLNPVDYKIWSIVQQWVYQSWVHNVDELKQHSVHVWHGIDQTIIDNAIDVSCVSISYNLQSLFL